MPVTHPHGTVNRYWDGPCRCLPCRLALSEWKRTHRPRVPVSKAQEAIAALKAQGMSLRAIAVAAGRSRAALIIIVNAERHGRRWVHADTLDALQGVTTKPFDADVLMDATVAKRQVRRMLAAGHTHHQIADAGDVYHVRVRQLSRSRSPKRCYASTAAGVERAYQALMFKEPLVWRTCVECGTESEWRGGHLACPSCRSTKAS